MDRLSIVSFGIEECFLFDAVQLVDKYIHIYLNLIETYTISLRIHSFIHSFIHSGHFYSAPSSPLLLRGAPDYSTDTISEFHAEAHRQLLVKDLPKVPT